MNVMRSTSFLWKVIEEIPNEQVLEKAIDFEVNIDKILLFNIFYEYVLYITI